MNKKRINIELPKGWTLATIGDLIGGKGIFVDGDWIESKDQDSEGNVRLIQLADVGDGEFKDRSSRFMTYHRAVELNCTFLNKGDLLIARMPDPLGRACLFPIESQEKFVTVVDVAIVRVTRENVNNKYLKYCINSPQVRSAIENFRTGTTRKRISRGNLATIKLPIPPINEQQRIVSKLDELFSELESSIASLKSAQRQLKVYEYDLINQAFSGELTEKWRKVNTVLPTHNLRTQINVLRQQQHALKLASWQDAIREWNKKRGRRPSKPKEIKELLPLSESILNIMQKIPNEWAWARLSDFTDIIGGVTKGKKYEAKKLVSVPYLRVANVQDGFLDLKEIKYIKITPDEVKKYKLEYGDVLYTEGGDKDKLGRGTMWRDEITSCIHQNHVFRARMISQEINPAYCAMYSRSVYAKNYFFGLAKQTTNLASINITVLSNLPFPLATRAEQDVIVELIESKTSLIQYLNSAITRSFAEARFLKQSILKRAIEGMLVDQDPLDEPASDLLQRIISEKDLSTIKENTMKKETRATKRESLKGRTILEVLKSSKKPMPAKAVWEQSKHKDDIESFYSELKKVQNKVVEIKRESYP